MRHKCGCIIERCGHTEILHKIRSCKTHSPRQLIEQQLDYDPINYPLEKMLSGDTPHLLELTSAVGDIKLANSPDDVAVEIGCGVSPYLGGLRKAGYKYVGIDGNMMACTWMRHQFQIECVNSKLEDAEVPHASLVLAAHCLEHVNDLSLCLTKIYNALSAGGWFYIIVPYGPADFWNRDHQWFFEMYYLRRCLTKHGFNVHKLIQMSIVQKEDFIYCLAQR